MSADGLHLLLLAITDKATDDKDNHQQNTENEKNKRDENSVQELFSKLETNGKLATFNPRSGKSIWVPAYVRKMQRYIWTDLKGSKVYTSTRGKLRQMIFLRNKQYMLKLYHCACKDNAKVAQA